MFGAWYATYICIKCLPIMAQYSIVWYLQIISNQICFIWQSSQIQLNCSTVFVPWSIYVLGTFKTSIPTLVDFIEITYLGVCHFLTVLMKNYFPELTVIATSHWGCGNRLMKKWVTRRKVIMKPKQIFKVHNWSIYSGNKHYEWMLQVMWRVLHLISPTL